MDEHEHDDLRKDFEKQRRFCTGEFATIQGGLGEIKRFIGINGKANELSLAARMDKVAENQQNLLMSQVRMSVKLGIVWGAAALLGSGLVTLIVLLLT